MKHFPHPVLCAVLEFLFAVFLVCLASLSIFTDVLLLHGSIGETSSVEWLQALLLLAVVQLYFHMAERRPDLRSGMLLAGGFFLCMFIREMDVWLDYLHHGFWLYPAILAALLCIIPALYAPRQAVAGLLAIIRHPSYGTLSAGLLCVLVFSRLFGMGTIWKHTMGLYYDRAVKNAAEEGIELFGYTLIFIAVLRFCGLPRWLERLKSPE